MDNKNFFSCSWVATSRLLLLLWLIFAVSCNQEQEGKVDEGASPYILEEIEAHLRNIYKKPLEKNEKLVRWELPELRYFIVSNTKEKMTQQHMDVIHEHFQHFSKVTGLPVRHSKGNKFKDADVSIIFTSDFYKAIRIPEIRRLFFYTRLDSIVEPILEKWKKQGLTTYGGGYYIDGTPGVFYTLIELTDNRKKGFDAFIHFAVFEIFDANNTITSRTSIKTITKRQEPVYFDNFPYEFDTYLLQSLYSDKVRYGMPMEEAIPILAKNIYHKFLAESVEK